ncbi:MAG: phosphatidate cytidylyltransferase, partial [Leptospiraceae bacterium]|nr:phosphatidate cytidylyltransferase [Leptospiraceae bacterium]
MSETARRILSAAVLVPLFLFCFYYAGWYYFQLYIFCLVAIYIGVKEFYGLANKEEEGKPFVKLGISFAFLLYTIAYLQFVQVQTHNPFPQDYANLLSRFIPPHSNIVFPLIFILFMLVYLLQILTRPLEGALFSTSTT